MRLHPKLSPACLHHARGIRGDYVVVTPHKYAYAGLQGPLSNRFSWALKAHKSYLNRTLSLKGSGYPVF